jgi:hypothetical protein
MCLTNLPAPKAAPPPPDPRKATLAAVEEQRRAQASRSGASANILTKLRDQDVADSALKKRLGQ